MIERCIYCGAPLGTADIDGVCMICKAIKNIKYTENINGGCNHNIDVKSTLNGVVSYCTICGKIFDCKHQQDFAFSKGGAE